MGFVMFSKGKIKKARSPILKTHLQPFCLKFFMSKPGATLLQCFTRTRLDEILVSVLSEIDFSESMLKLVFRVNVHAAFALAGALLLAD